MSIAADATFRDLTAQHAFLRLWLARLAGTAASQMLMVAIGWQMYDLTGSAWDLGLIGLYQFAPACCWLYGPAMWRPSPSRPHRCLLPGCAVRRGPGVDELRAAANGPRATCCWACRWCWARCAPFQMSAQQALTPVLVPLALLQRAMAFSSAGMQGAIIGGPALGGLMFVAGADMVYATRPCCLALACVLMARLRYRHVPPPREPVSAQDAAGRRALHLAAQGGAGRGLARPVRRAARRRHRACCRSIAQDILHVGPGGLGLLRGAPAVGALLMSIALARWPLRRHVGPHAAGRGGGVRRCMIVFGLSTSVRAVVRRAAVIRRRRHGQRRHPPDAGAAGNARRHARPRSAPSTRVHRRQSTSSASSSPAPRRPCSGRSARWWRAASARCWWRSRGGGSFPRLAGRDRLESSAPQRRA